MPRMDATRPRLAVADLSRTIEFYTKKLGLTLNATFGEAPAWCDVSRDGQSSLFNAPARECVRRNVPRSPKDYQIFYFNTDGVTGLHAELKARGVRVTDLRVNRLRHERV